MDRLTDLPTSFETILSSSDLTLLAARFLRDNNITTRTYQLSSSLSPNHPNQNLNTSIPQHRTPSTASAVSAVTYPAKETKKRKENSLSILRMNTLILQRLPHLHKKQQDFLPRHAQHFHEQAHRDSFEAFN